MKADIVRLRRNYGFWVWRIKSRNGTVVSVGPYYTRRDNAIRGLRNFVEKMWTTIGIEKIMDNL